MRFLQIITVVTLFLTFSYSSKAQNFNAELRQLKGQIDAARKAGKLTELEHSKLKREQEIIKLIIEKANADNVMTPSEKNKIHSKIVRSKKRLAKYKTNREIY
jgi:hypothetical protein